MIDLQPHHFEIVKTILAKHMPSAEIRAFGSRVTGSARSYSDLDLVIVGPAKINRKSLYRLEEAFEASDLPFRVDVLDWHRISESFHKVIEQAYEVIQSPEQRQISR
jgi:predicted nucleotidyltransferase